MSVAPFVTELHPGLYIDNFLELLQVTRLHSADLCLCVAPQEVVKGLRAGQGISALLEIPRVLTFLSNFTGTSALKEPVLSNLTMTVLNMFFFAASSDGS